MVPTMNKTNRVTKRTAAAMDHITNSFVKKYF